MKNEEDLIQNNIVNVIRLMFPKSVLFSVPNGGWRSKGTASRLKATGVLQGVADLIFLHNGVCYFIEVKSKKGTQVDSQKEFQKKVEAQGFNYWLVKSTQEFIDKIETLNK